MLLIAFLLNYFFEQLYPMQALYQHNLTLYYIPAGTNNADDHDDNYSKSQPWYQDRNSLMLACSYTLICTQQLAGLDILTLLGIVLAIICIFAMLVI